MLTKRSLSLVMALTLIRLQLQLEGCIDDERQFKTAKRPHAPGDATVQKRFSAITSLLFVVDRKE